MNVVNVDRPCNNIDVHHKVLLQFYRRLGHLCYDMITKTARDSIFIIMLTNINSINCLACAKEKQNKSIRSRGSGLNSTIDAIVEVIGSDLETLMAHISSIGNYTRSID